MTSLEAARASGNGTALGDLRAYGTGSAIGAAGFDVSALNMMVLTPGKERSADEYKRQFERSGLRSIWADFDLKIFERNIEIYAKRINQGTYPWRSRNNRPSELFGGKWN
jgi:hypothetical protein